MRESILRCDRCREVVYEPHRTVLHLSGSVGVKALGGSELDVCPACVGRLAAFLRTPDPAPPTTPDPTPGLTPDPTPPDPENHADAHDA